jgi:hypothetical protein
MEKKIQKPDHFIVDTFREKIALTIAFGREDGHHPAAEPDPARKVDARQVGSLPVVFRSRMLDR